MYLKRNEFELLSLSAKKEFIFRALYKWDKIFKNGPSKIYGRQSLKNLKGSA